ncbi:LytTR family DNA-binding domain-containing protein [Chryseolinea sp. T2]|uniref:LytR/AlgR family response regulator transcription factor n=1 Tax=Chryseolinea sp. T2 TaxID=3129255 RepID=UPI003076E122
MPRAIIVDDEAHCVDTLGLILQDYCPTVEVVATCRSAQDGIARVNELRPDIIFLDIEMPMMNGFEMLEQLKGQSFAIIFTTSFDQYALRAIRFSALDYLLKPVDPRELIAAVNRVQSASKRPVPEQYDMLLDRLGQKVNTYRRIAIPTLNGYELLNADDIVFCEADDNYTLFHLKNKSKLTATLMLKDAEEQLEEFQHFVRVHHSYIANINEAVRYVRGEGGYLVMSEGSSVNVSRSRKNLLMKWFHKDI